MFQAIVHASRIYTGKGFRKHDGRKPQEAHVDEILDGAVVYSTKKTKGKVIPDRIEWVGPTDKLPTRYRRVRKRDLKGKFCITAGLVDCHNHPLFAGDRSEEFALRCGGVSYEEIARQGGGIVSTIFPTREASEAQLFQLAKARVQEAYRFGVRTLEMKSGYGLDFESELKLLRVAKRIREAFPQMTFQTTFLGAHAFPPDKAQDDYVDEVVDQMLPAVKKQRLADACDVFIDRGYFSVEQGKRILEAALKKGLKIKLHGDELADLDCARFATEMQALSVDHLLKVNAYGISALANSDTVAVVLPGTAFYLKESHAPARQLIDAGACVAIATDFNPGSCACNSLPTILTISALYLGLTRAELLASVTYNAAKALGMQKKKGTIEKGKDADFTIHSFKSFEESYYRFAWGPTSRY